ncbi:MAG TPA: hypothetical protein DDY24_09455 [Alcaligenaceae bacterium]|nr:hypothetical protein [Alcaligenaceae bacterium]
MNNTKITFVPKTREERLAFNQRADDLKKIADQQEARLRKEVLPTYDAYPFESPVEHDDIVIERVMMPMRDNVCLRSYVYRPKASGSYPVILSRGPYDMNGSMDKWPALYRHLARRGYVCVTQDVRGRFGSEGEFVPMLNEHEDTYDAIEWLAIQPWSNGRVGMTGVSYLGYTSYCGAIMNAPSLKAIMPVCINYGMEVTTGAPTLSGIVGWLVWAGHNISGLKNAARIDWMHLPLDQIDDEAEMAHPWYKSQVRERYDEVSMLRKQPDEIEKAIAKIKIPTYVVAGWYDNLTEGMLTNYERQAKGSSDLRLVIGPWHHNLGDLEQPFIGKIPTPDVYLNRWYLEMERFFNHYLKEDGKPWSPPGPVLLYILGTNEWRYEQEWPLARAQPTAIYLSSSGRAATDMEDGKLTWDEPASEVPDQYDYNPLNPVRSIEGLNIWHFNHYMGDRQTIEARDDVLVYTTAVLQDDMEVTGIIEATLYAASSAPDTDFMVNLIDVYPDGHTQFLTHGVMRVTYREGLHERKLIEPGRIYKYEFKLQPIGVKFQKGHRMRVEITSSEMDKYARNQNVADAPGTTANVAIAHQTIYHGREYPSKLVLPMIPSSGFYDFGKGY